MLLFLVENAIVFSLITEKKNVYVIQVTIFGKKLKYVTGKLKNLISSNFN